jgi:RND superfamily putative drug exporter
MSTATAVRPPDDLGLSAPRPGPLGRVAGASYRHRGRTVLAWLGVLGLAVLLSTMLGGQFHADYSAPGSDSQRAQQVLAAQFPTQSGDSLDVVFQSAAPASAPATRAAVTAVLAQLSAAPHVAGVQSPYAAPGGISADGHTLLAQGRLDVVNPNDMPVSASTHLLAIAKKASTGGLTVFLGGQSIEQAEQGSIGSEGLGIAAAAIILLLTFGTVVAAGLPILVAVSGLAVSSMLTGVVISFVDAPDWSTSLATMMGIGIGIDYALLMVTRFREWRAAGLDPERATVATLDTAGRAVMVAGTTVVISMLGLFAMGLSFMLGYLGRHVDRLRVPLGRRGAAPTVSVGGHVEAGRGWLAWSRFVQRRRVAATVVGVAVLLGLAAPFLGVRFGFPDAGNDRSGTSTRQAYDTVARGFGPGANGPLLLAAELPSGTGAASLDALGAALRSTRGHPRHGPVRARGWRDRGFDRQHQQHRQAHPAADRRRGAPVDDPAARVVP